MRDSNYSIKLLLIIIDSSKLTSEYFNFSLKMEYSKEPRSQKIDSFKNYRQDNGKFIVMSSEIRNIRSRGSNFLF